MYDGGGGGGAHACNRKGFSDGHLCGLITILVSFLLSQLINIRHGQLLHVML